MKIDCKEMTVARFISVCRELKAEVDNSSKLNFILSQEIVKLRNIILRSKHVI